MTTPAPTASAIAASTSSTASSADRHRWTRLAPRTASAGVAATFAPASRSGAVLAVVRFHAVTGAPRLRNPWTKPEPRRPVPRKAMVTAGLYRTRADAAGRCRTFASPSPAACGLLGEPIRPRPATTVSVNRSSHLRIVPPPPADDDAPGAPPSLDE